MIDDTVLRSVDAAGKWDPDWLWGLPIIVFTVVIHVIGLGMVRLALRRANSRIMHPHSRSIFVVVIGCVTFSATVLHAIEAILWASAYRLLGALPDYPDAILYSLNAITSYGHANLYLERRWELMGALESLNGWLLFGLSTAFLFAVIERMANLDRG